MGTLAPLSLGPFVGHLANGKHPTSSVEVDETEAHPAPPASSTRSGTPAYLLPALSRLLFGLCSSASTSPRHDASRYRTRLFSIATLLVPWGGPRRKIKILSPPATIDARLGFETELPFFASTLALLCSGDHPLHRPSHLVPLLGPCFESYRTRTRVRRLASRPSVPGSSPTSPQPDTYHTNDNDNNNNGNPCPPPHRTHIAAQATIASMPAHRVDTPTIRPKPTQQPPHATTQRRLPVRGRRCSSPHSTTPSSFSTSLSAP